MTRIEDLEAALKAKMTNVLAEPGLFVHVKAPALEADRVSRALDKILSENEDLRSRVWLITTSDTEVRGLNREAMAKMGWVPAETDEAKPDE